VTLEVDEHVFRVLVGEYAMPVGVVPPIEVQIVHGLQVCFDPDLLVPAPRRRLRRLGKMHGRSETPESKQQAQRDSEARVGCAASGAIETRPIDGGIGCITPNESWSRAYGATMRP
jgi:hypothetical protein